MLVHLSGGLRLPGKSRGFSLLFRTFHRGCTPGPQLAINPFERRCNRIK